MTIKESLKENLVAIISLVIAIIALTFNTHRGNQTEYQRNIRQASFSILSELSQLQLLVDQAHYGMHFGHKGVMPNPIVGWARINYMQDLAQVVPKPVGESITTLKQIWTVQVDTLGVSSSANKVDKEASLNSNRKITEQIHQARMTVKQVLHSLE